MNTKILFMVSLIITCGFFITGCTTVRAYQKNKINDSEMELSSRKVEKEEMNFQTYNEGASGGVSGKAGGGCGCN
jgi:uncharacterized protein DUF4266